MLVPAGEREDVVRAVEARIGAEYGVQRSDAVPVRGRGAESGEDDQTLSLRSTPQQRDGYSEQVVRTYKRMDERTKGVEVRSRGRTPRSA